MIELVALAQDVGAVAKSTVPSAGFWERLVTPLGGFVAILAVSLIVHAALRRRVWWNGVFLVIGILALNWLLLVSGKMIQLEWTALSWNWPGKILATLMTAMIIWRAPVDPARDLGLTLEQTPGSTGPVAIVFALYCALVWGIEFWLNGAAGLVVPSGETLAFQAVMPSLEEELLFRGLALFVLARAFASPLPSGVWFGPAAIALSLAFGLNHAVSYSGGWHFNGMAFALTGLFGLTATWMRLKSGSLLFPFLLHSASNLGLSFL